MLQPWSRQLALIPPPPLPLLAGDTRGSIPAPWPERFYFFNLFIKKKEMFSSLLRTAVLRTERPAGRQLKKLPVVLHVTMTCLPSASAVRMCSQPAPADRLCGWNCRFFSPPSLPPRLPPVPVPGSPPQTSLPARDERRRRCMMKAWLAPKTHYTKKLPPTPVRHASTCSRSSSVWSLRRLRGDIGGVVFVFFSALERRPWQ